MLTEDSWSEAAMAQLLFGTNINSDLQQIIHWPDEDDDLEGSQSARNFFPCDDNSSLSYSWYQSSNGYSAISDDHLVENYYLNDTNLASEVVSSYHKPSTKRKAKTSTDIMVSKKGQKNIKKVELEDHSNCCSLEDDLNKSREIDDSQLTQSRSKGSDVKNKSVKSKAKGESLIHSQSMYARKRRERINQRLRTLQGLIPNGTKVDISTMLEEAVQYVKFLQLQIKLLSSDDMWMYASIAYNAMSIGVDLKISTPE